jgi:4-hydroxy-3-methylbut-2-en-1-yl diphosphate reductase
MTVCAPMRVERVALRHARSPVVRTGMGPARSLRSSAALPDGGVLVAGVGGGLGDAVRPGDVVVATEVRGADRVVPCPSAPMLAGALRRDGLTVHLGPIVSRPRVVTGAARRELAATGALGVDTESVWLAPPPGVPFAAIRVIVDTDRAPLIHPGSVRRGFRALRHLRRATPAIDAWIAALGPRDLVRLDADCDVADCDLVLDAVMINDASEIDLALLAGATRIGIAADARTPVQHVDDLIFCLSGFGPMNFPLSQFPLSQFPLSQFPLLKASLSKEVS